MVLERNWGAVEETAQRADRARDAVGGGARRAALHRAAHADRRNQRRVAAPRRRAAARRRPDATAMKRLAAILLPALVAALCTPAAPGAEPVLATRAAGAAAGLAVRRPARRAGRPPVPGPEPRAARGEGQRDRAAEASTSTTASSGISSPRSAAGPGARLASRSPSTREFWTISTPSPPRNREAGGLALCRFLDGNVVGSYSTSEQAADPFREMTAAPAWRRTTAGSGASAPRTPTGQRRGAFHLHWDGANLETVYAPQGRGVSDLEAAPRARCGRRSGWAGRRAT